MNFLVRQGYRVTSERTDNVLFIILRRKSSVYVGGVIRDVTLNLWHLTYITKVRISIDRDSKSYYTVIYVAAEGGTAGGGEKGE